MAYQGHSPALVTELLLSNEVVHAHLPSQKHDPAKRSAVLMEEVYEMEYVSVKKGSPGIAASCKVRLGVAVDSGQLTAYLVPGRDGVLVRQSVV